jgi:hypothetical protein
MKTGGTRASITTRVWAAAVAYTALYEIRTILDEETG